MLWLQLYFFPVLPSLTLQFVSAKAYGRAFLLQNASAPLSSCLLVLTVQTIPVCSYGMSLRQSNVLSLYESKDARERPLHFQRFPFLEAPFSTRPKTDCGSRIKVNIGHRSDLRSSEGGIHVLKPPQDIQNTEESPFTEGGSVTFQQHICGLCLV